MIVFCAKDMIEYDQSISRKMFEERLDEAEILGFTNSLKHPWSLIKDTIKNMKRKYQKGTDLYPEHEHFKAFMAEARVLCKSNVN